MKRRLVVTILLGAFVCSGRAMAQSTIEKTGKKVESGAKQTGDAGPQTGYLRESCEGGDLLSIERCPSICPAAYLASVQLSLTPIRTQKLGVVFAALAAEQTTYIGMDQFTEPFEDYFVCGHLSWHCR